MTGSRRLHQRHGGAKLDTQSLDDSGGPVVNVQSPPLPRHCQLPEIPTLNEIVFQLGYLVSALVLMALQYLNLYNTINWIPYRRHEYALDFNAIDTDLVVLIVLLLCNRPLKTVLARMFEYNERIPVVVARLIKYVLLFIYYLPIVGTSWLLTSKYPAFNCLSLLIPAVLYFIMFGPNISGYLLKHLPWLPMNKPSHPYDVLVPSPTERTSRNIYHACSTNPEHTRREVFILKTDFNYRLKIVYFEAMYSVFCSTIVPFIFCRHTYHLDKAYICSYILVSALTMTLTGFVQRVPASYMDTLHRSAMHLGNWKRHEERIANFPHATWSELTVWPKGVSVRHVKGLFKAEGCNNAAEPGNSMHSKFYKMFRQPRCLSGFISLLCCVCTLLQFLMLAEYRHWYQVLATCGLMFNNYYTLYISVRDSLILSQVYKDEKPRHN
ncbi:transmembrane protein 39A-B-like [Watersipora subatra]|uniref:transmembrane protein 39A-B-like n=1 Tax=Watersipora subatra TaxID=2589382 RepID=UPI00355BF7B5